MCVYIYIIGGLEPGLVNPESAAVWEVEGIKVFLLGGPTTCIRDPVVVLKAKKL